MSLKDNLGFGAVAATVVMYFTPQFPFEVPAIVRFAIIVTAIAVMLYAWWPSSWFRGFAMTPALSLLVVCIIGVALAAYWLIADPKQRSLAMGAKTSPPNHQVVVHENEGGQGAERKPDGTLKAGDGGNAQLPGGGGGGGGGLRINPDGSADAGGGGGAGGDKPGGHGGGPLGGGGGGRAGYPPGFFETDAGKILVLQTELRQQYAAEFGSTQVHTLPEKWVNDQLKKRGLPYTYTIDNGSGVWTKTSQKP